MKLIKRIQTAFDVLVGKPAPVRVVKAKAKALKPYQERDLCRDYLAGAKAQDLGIKYKISEGTVYRILRGHGVSRKKHN